MKKVLLIFILILALSLRFYKLGDVPPSISWDEAAVGYNAWTILNWGKDEWGKTLPLIFKSFEDFKHPIHIYLTVPTIALFGLNEFGVRASAAIFGVLNVAVIYLLAKRLFKNDWIGSISAFVLAVSPYNIHFSRFNHEFNFVIFFFMLGVYLILKGIEKKNYLIVLGFAILGIDLLTYHSAKIVVPPIIFLIVAIYAKDLWRLKKYLLWSFGVLGLFVSLLFIEPNLLGGARLAQTSSSQERSISMVASKYVKHFTYEYLFVRGDINPRLSAQTGTFYKMDFMFLVFGVGVLVWGLIKGRKEYLIVIIWLALAPIPASITSEAPHAARAMFMSGSMHLLIAVGIFTFISFFKNRYISITFAGVIVLLTLYSLVGFARHYFGEYREQYAIEWQYGMKQVVNQVINKPDYHKVYVDNIRQQPYIFFLFYLKTPLPELLSSVKYDESQAKSYNTVRSFGKYQFGNWDIIESYPGYRILYVVTPSYYTGLRYKDLFNLDNLVKYPNGTEAFYLVSGHEL